MKEEILFDRLTFLDMMQQDRRQQIINYFRTAPDSLAEYFIVENLAPNRVFVREGALVDYVYLIANGIVKATDYRVFGTEFDFTRFDKAYVMGGMEVLMRVPAFLTTLTTVTKCTIIKIPIEPYVQWVRSDVDALQLEAQLMGEYLLEQGKLARAYLFLQGADRLMYLLIRKYEKYGNNGVYHIKVNQQNLANETGLVVKTVSRAIKKMEEEGMISRSQKFILINHDQYLRMKEYVDRLIYLNDEK
ncbi:MAG: Crp/Fnr family transcriptional regulator [Firmicutes bacterium]|nr:Crp/Fnr family transcriptional regulator [Bacillota bacterium]